MALNFYLDASTYIDPSLLSERIELSLDTIDEFTLNDLHTNSGYSDHSNTGYDDHYHSGCTNHYNSGCSDHTNYPGYYVCYDSTCWDFSDSGYSNYDNSYFCYNEYNMPHYNCANLYYAYGDYTVCTNTGCSNHTDTGCYQYTNYSIQSEAPIDYGYDNHSNTGYSDHGDSGCLNHSNSGCTNHTNYTNNYDPNLSGVVTGGSAIYNTSVPMTWPAATHSLAPGQSAQTITYYLYYKYKSPFGASFGDWQVPAFANTTSTSYNWDVTSKSAGYYIVRVRAWDGQEWNDNGGTTPPASVTATDVALSGIDSAQFIIIHYAAPSWPNVIDVNENLLYGEDMDFTRTEANEARTAWTMDETTWTDPNVVVNGAVIKAVHITELRTSSNAVNTALGHTTFGWTNSTITQGTLVKGAEVRDIQVLLEDLT